MIKCIVCGKDYIEQNHFIQRCSYCNTVYKKTVYQKCLVCNQGLSGVKKDAIILHVCFYCGYKKLIM